MGFLESKEQEEKGDGLPENQEGHKTDPAVCAVTAAGDSREKSAPLGPKTTFDLLILHPSPPRLSSLVSEVSTMPLLPRVSGQAGTSGRALSPSPSLSPPPAVHVHGILILVMDSCQVSGDRGGLIYQIGD